MIDVLEQSRELRRAPAFRSPEDPHEGAHSPHIDPITSRVLAALFEKSQARRGNERRCERRYPYPHPVYLTPLTDDGPQVDQTVQVFGRHLSEHGLDFCHRDPLPYRRVIASLPIAGGWLGLVLDLKWCRFTTDGLYDNGGRFVGAVPSPLTT
jgi:hypothetical protein